MQEKVFFHIDVNSAFLSWEAAYRLHVLGEKVDLRKIPAVVGGDKENRHGIVLAKSDQAKRCKIHTGEALGAALQKCPSLTIVPPNYEMYIKASKAMMEILQRFSPRVDQYSIDEAFIDMSGSDLLYGSPVSVANNLKDMIHEELKFTVNVGVSCNRLLAKMAGELKKPNLVHSLFPEEIEKKMWPLPVSELFFVGRATEKKLKNLGILTIGQLAKTDPDILKAHFGKNGEVIYQFANGNDISSFFTQPVANKGYGNSVTTPYDVVTMAHARMVLLSLCETVCTRLRKDDVKGSVASVSYTDCNFTHVSHQGIMFSATNTTTELYNYICKLFEQLWDETMPLRQLGVHVSRITSEQSMQYNLFDGDRYERMGQLDRAIDKIRNRYGEDSVMRACFLNTSTYHMQGGTCKERRTGITKPLA
ncbi:MAG: DNA polymerase IV [Clostridiales bacterium]|nr:DNA polymerase IV [Clostridiales bacterium]